MLIEITQLGTTEALSLLIISRRVSSTIGVPHTKMKQRFLACIWAGVYVDVRRACGVREEVAARLTAAQGYGAPSVLARLASGNFAPLSKHRGRIVFERGGFRASIFDLGRVLGG